MSNLETLQKHNTDLQNLIEKAESLPEKGDFGKQLDALIDGTITEVYSGVTSVREKAFYKCETLTSANFPNATAADMEAFRNCTALKSLNFPKVSRIGMHAFRECSNLESASFPSVTIVESYAFYLCTGLTSVELPNATRIGMCALGSCKLTSIDLPNVTSIDSDVFLYCGKLTSVILRSQNMCKLSNKSAFSNCYHILGTVHSTHNPNGDKDGYFYVPRALVEDYKVATNWSTYATQFRALEDYTVDGTITGELDPNKI